MKELKDRPHSSEAVIYVKDLDSKSLIEMIYKKGHELGLKPSLDQKKY